MTPKNKRRRGQDLIDIAVCVREAAPLPLLDGTPKSLTISYNAAARLLEQEGKRLIRESDQEVNNGR